MMLETDKSRRLIIVKEKTKLNIRLICAFLMLSVVLFWASILLHKKEAACWGIVTIFFVGVWYVSFFVIVYNIYAIIRKKKRNRYLENLPYSFNYSLEYEIYRRIGHTNNKKWEKKYASIERTVPLKYSEWKASLTSKYNNLANNEDFYRFLKRTSRSKEIYYDVIVSVTAPLEIAVLTVMASLAHTEAEIMAILILSVIMIMILVVKEMLDAKEEHNFVDDVIAIFHSNSEK